MNRVRLTLSVADTHLGEMETVAASAKKAGMAVEQQLEAIGVITGEIDSDKLKALREVEGIASVEEERQAGVAPPDSAVQ